MILICIFIPWLSFFLRGDIMRGIICLLLQISLIGWLPAAIWAVMRRSDVRAAALEEKLEKRHAEMMDAMSNVQQEAVQEESI